MPTRSERLEGGLLGLLVGDALGVPYEFKPPEDLPRAADIDFEPPHWFARAHASVRPGTWSDDGAQALCLLESLLMHERFEPDDFARRMVNWYDHGHLAVDGYVFDVGVQTGAALRRIASGTPPLSAASREVSANGNGALMRVLPLALFCRGSDAELVRDAKLSSQVTHGHLRSQLCCALYCLWVRRLLAETSEPWADAVETLRGLLADDEAALSELTLQIGPEQQPETPGSGYVVDSLRAARVLFDRPSYESIVIGAIELGYDTDTTAAIAGGAAGVRDGVQGIPKRWLQALRGRDLLDPLLRRLLDQRG